MENTHVNESILSAEILEDQKKNRIDHMKYLKGMEDIGSEVLDKVVSEMEAYDYDKYNEADVRRALAHSERTPEDFRALLSPAALPLLEEIAQAAQVETRKHFGNSVYMFTPIYIANYCENYCIYCGFNCHNKINRAQLNAEEIEKEIATLIDKIVSASTATMEYINERIDALDEEKKTVKEKIAQMSAEMYDRQNIGVISDYMSKWNDISIDDKLTVVDTLIESIHVGHGKVKIAWKI